MAKQTIGIGTVANDGTGDDLRTGGDKINDNFNEIYTAFGDGSTLGTYQVQLAEGAFANGDKTKLDGIEAGADVTDAANVETAIEAITLASVSGATGDEVLIVDATDGGLKAVLWENLPGAGGGMSSFSLAGTSGTPQTIGDGNTATIAAGTGITTTAGATDTVTVAIDSTVATLTGTQTLTNKTLTAPVLSGTVTGTYTLGGTPTFPATVVSTTGTQTLTNKTIGAATISGDLVPNADGTVDLGSTTNRFAVLSVDSIDLNGVTLDGTTLADPGADRILFWDDSAGTTAYLTAGTGLSISTTNLTIDSTVATLTGTQTLTNKTLTDPKVSHGYNAQTGTTYTLVAADQSKVITMSNASANTLTIPPNSSVAFPVGTIVTVFQLGAGVTTIAGGTGVTLTGNGGSGSAFSADIQTQYGAATIIKIATDQWLISGDIDTVAA